MDYLETDDGTPVVELSYSELQEFAEGDRLYGELCPNGCVDTVGKAQSEVVCENCSCEYIIRGK